jgi:exopolysaccharide biosynthesis WecB/TagA/CpsF family protein
MASDVPTSGEPSAMWQELAAQGRPNSNQTRSRRDANAPRRDPAAAYPLGPFRPTKPRRCPDSGGMRLAIALTPQGNWSGAMQLAATALQQKRRPIAHIGRLPIDAVDIQETAQAFIHYCLSAEREKAERPVYSSSVNGQVISLCARDRKLAQMFLSADSLNADGQPLVFLSRYLCAHPLPERVATSDLFPVVARLAAKAGVTFYMLGGSEEVNRKAMEASLAADPSLRIVGRRNGYFSRAEEPAVVAEIARLKPDVLWVSLGVPLEQQFCLRNLTALRGVGIVKTSGGLFDFLSRAKPRAPAWMQKSGLEWLFRMSLEPQRLFWRYLVTNPHALFVMVRTSR